jgi:hypothetical protein
MEPDERAERRSNKIPNGEHRSELPAIWPRKARLVSNLISDDGLLVADTHASPGRFLAVAEMKLILATILLEYDIKLIPGTAPKTMYFATSRIPDLKLPILMKARTTKDGA